jgi:outer membrane lipoprotein-sorting protein
MKKPISAWAFVAFVACLAGLAATSAPAAEWPADAPQPTLAQLMACNAAARGGLDAWRRIETMVWVGHLESSSALANGLPFQLDLKRPNQARFELIGAGQKSLRVFDGHNGWKLRPGRGGAGVEVQPYGSDEIGHSRDEQVIDGLLIDHQAKGHVVTVAGSDEVQGQAAYRLIVRLPSGKLAKVWIDAASCLEIKVEREAGAGSPAVAIHYRDYRDFEGLKIPRVIETRHAADGQVDSLVIDRVSLNPPLGDKTFARPGPASRRGQVTVDARAAAAPGALGPNR